MSVATITLTRDQRVALHAIVADELVLIFDRGCDDLDDVREVVDRAAPWLALIDQVGWQEGGTRERFDLDADADWLRTFLERRRAGVAQDLEHERRALPGARAGDPGYLLHRGGSFAEAEGQPREAIDRDLDEVGRCDVVLAALNDSRRD